MNLLRSKRTFFLKKIEQNWARKGDVEKNRMRISYKKWYYIFSISHRFPSRLGGLAEGLLEYTPYLSDRFQNLLT